MVGNTSHDILMGKMLERTDVLLQQAEESRATIQALNSTMGTLRDTVSKLGVTVETIGDAVAEGRQLEERLRRCEERKTDHDENTRFRKTVVRYGLLMAVAATAGGGTLGNLLSKAMGLH